MLWEHSLVMVDQQTGTLWSHLLGQAMEGPLQGEFLPIIPAQLTDWATWHREFPQTTAVRLSRTASGLRRGAYQSLDRYVIGLSHKGRARAWRFDRLAEHRVVNDRIGETRVLVVFDPASTTANVYDRTVDGRVLTFERQNGALVDRETNRGWNLLSGACLENSKQQLKRLAGIVSFTKAWQRFHPETTLWDETHSSAPTDVR